VPIIADAKHGPAFQHKGTKDTRRHEENRRIFVPLGVLVLKLSYEQLFVLM
jgi:hypothetical protein